MSLSEAVVEVVIEVDAEFAGGSGETQEGVPGCRTGWGAGAAADFAFAHDRAQVEFGLVVVQG